jgi:hypothetical protein
MPAADPAVLSRLEADGVVRRDGDGHRTTRRWQSAMARAAFRLYAAGDDGSDLRLPVAFALVEIYGTVLPDAELAALVEHMLPIETRELDPRDHLARARATGAGAEAPGREEEATR